ncbi:MAG: DinB family protein [Lacipirellulaceae bacterium]
MNHHQPDWYTKTIDAFASYKRMIDGCVEQLSDQELTARPIEEMNSVATLLRHLGGNLKSRFSDFLTTDGEKADRDRELEFADWEGDRESLVAYFNEGWKTLTNTLESLGEEDLEREVLIRGEAHTVAQALLRAVTHVAYHAGQIALIARMVHQSEWKWLTVEPGGSARHNRETWGTAASRSVFGSEGSVPIREEKAR